MKLKIPSRKIIKQLESFASHWRRNCAYSIQNHPTQSNNIVLVVGAPRSGTTLIQLLLGAHSMFFTAAQETGFFTWQDLFASDRRFHGYTIDELQSKYGLIRSHIELLEVLARDGREVSGKEYYVEKTPQHVLRLKRLIELLPRARFINVIRDGRDCYLSARITGFIPQAASLEKFARYWKRCILAREALGTSPSIFDIVYEKFVQDPENELHRLMAFLGETFEASQLEVKSRASDKRASETGFRRLAEPIVDNTVGLWRHNLSKDELRLFERIAGAELARYGYGAAGSD